MTSPTFPLSGNFIPVSESTFRQIVLNGQYYFPASNHYQRTTTVNCDRCQRTQIPACIGWREYDLCLGCAQLIVEQNAVMRVQPRIPQVQQAQSRIPPMVTRMHISSAYPRQTQETDQDQGPIRVTNMQVSSAFPTTKMQVSSAFPRQSKSQDQFDSEPVTFMQVFSAFPTRK